MHSSIKPIGLSVSDAAALFTKNRNFIYRRVKEGKLTLVKISARSSLITVESLVKFAEERGLVVRF